MVDLPESLDGNKMGSTGALMTLYAMVNSLTDPVNTSNIKEVQFLVGGKVVKSFGNLEFSEPFIRNPAIIQE
jgi:germination protein M